jgi:hypothetical protein
MPFQIFDLVHCGNTPFHRFAINTLVVWPMLGLYMLINHHRPASPTIVPMPAWVPFWPVFLIFYLAMLLTTWLLPVAISDPARFRAYLIANVCGYLLVAPWWILIPTIIPRPPEPNGAWASVFGLFWAIDQPYNVMPCAHGIGPVTAAWFAVQVQPAWRWPLLALLTVGLSSVALTWQHRPTDILLGGIATAIGIIVGETLLVRARREAQK